MFSGLHETLFPYIDVRSRIPSFIYVYRVRERLYLQWYMVARSGQEFLSISFRCAIFFSESFYRKYGGYLQAWQRFLCRLSNWMPLRRWFTALGMMRFQLSFSDFLIEEKEACSRMPERCLSRASRKIRNPSRVRRLDTDWIKSAKVEQK